MNPQSSPWFIESMVDRPPFDCTVLTELDVSLGFWVLALPKYPLSRPDDDAESLLQLVLLFVRSFYARVKIGSSRKIVAKEMFAYEFLKLPYRFDFIVYST
ncbi:hypothetical protein BpHYR1_034836 [Brachionus plicatilis]|uniref:Uncharacterized protein n=1 Tax=Brachionus plicatilis TaxID=10195 RepID=A0A3M7TA89_BRAPC|nr:hypothetical protein BpHYR1_034836 [Brachionus plicatilis]